MKKTLEDELLYIRNLEANIKAAKDILEREQKRLEALQEECNHDIVIIAKVISPGYSLHAKCLFCGENFSTPHELRELPHKHYSLECYISRLCNFPEDELYDFITSKTKKIISKNPNITKVELYNELEKFLRNY